ncbi:MAG: response regulator [Nitrospirota bacterium]|nr:response regulator [Nitrospirota bacterium]
MDTALNILLVDDEERILEFFQDMLRDMGYAVTAVTSASLALEAVVREKFDLAFLDQFLGPLRGLELMDRIREKDPNIYFVMVTANGSPELAVEALQRGASDFVVKPFFESDIIRSIDYVRKKRDLDGQQRMIMAELEQRVREKTEELIHVNFSVLTSLARAVEKKDLGTYGHSMRVSRYAGQIAEELQLSAAMRNDLGTAALLHDIGKIGISDTILGKPGPLTEIEMAEVRRHPENGVEILRPMKHYQSVLPAIQYHHEHFNGRGYPHGLAGEEIPLLARIIAVADTYDAILSDRPYRSAANHDQAMSVLKEHAGTQFDPLVVQAMERAISISSFERERPLTVMPQVNSYPCSVDSTTGQARYRIIT